MDKQIKTATGNYEEQGNENEIIYAEIAEREGVEVAEAVAALSIFGCFAPERSLQGNK
jgi:hypothetical protein